MTRADRHGCVRFPSDCDIVTNVLQARWGARTTIVVALLVATVTVGVTAGAAGGPIQGPARATATAARLQVPQAPAPAPSPEQQAAAQVVDVLNAERSGRGLAPYAWQAQVGNAAQLHSADMANRRQMSHTGGDGSSVGQRITRAGFRWRAVGENVAFGYRDARSVVRAWLDSSGHRPQMLGSYTYIGVGLAYSATGVPYWTLDVAS